MKHVVGPDVIVIRDVDDAAVGGIDGDRNISSCALQSQETVKVEFHVLHDANAGLAVAAVCERLEFVCSGAAVIVPHDDDVRRAIAAGVVEGQPGMKDRINGAVRMYGETDRRTILPGGVGTRFDVH